MMKKFIISFVLFIFTPILIILGVYLVTDPFKTLHPFSLEYFDSTNRDYMSTELFLQNKETYNYDSFIFGSSRCGGINSYHWKSYLNDSSNQFVFQAWSETITGIWQKIKFIENNGIQLKNVLILLDIPSSFAKDQLPTQALSIKSWKTSGQNPFIYQSILFYNFLQKPSFWVESIKKRINRYQDSPNFDIISNDWCAENINADISIRPVQDSLNGNSAISKKVLLSEIQEYGYRPQEVSEELINDHLESILKDIQKTLEKMQSNYEIIITPAIWQTNKSINPNDRQKLIDIFGNCIYDYSDKNDITDDINNFSDSGHFGLCAGWDIIEDIYSERNL